MGDHSWLFLWFKNKKYPQEKLPVGISKIHSTKETSLGGCCISDSFTMPRLPGPTKSTSLMMLEVNGTLIVPQQPKIQGKR